ncbi:MAG TPA: type I-E CRISPR-associated protein Cse1/CasA [Armatimonadota bacterium]|nr:type I-E CRISPR-associated protein Cse1/CasA [Armatimonadota bacterium]
MPSFDLRDEPWIPVLRLDGTAELLGLRRVLDEAHRLRAMHDPFPTVEFGLYRLLVALLLDIAAPDSLAALGGLLRQGRLDPAALDAYFTRWADRFDLFHPRYPFLQTAAMAGDAAKPLAGLFAAIPSGTNAVHFHHAREDDFGVCSAMAARLLTTLAPFMTAGGAGLSPSINGAPPWYVLVQGQTLFETLCLNLPVLEIPTAAGTAPPAWRNPEPVEVRRYRQTSVPEAFTWRPRRLRLLPEAGPGACAVTGAAGDVLIRQMQFAPGAACDFTWFDPNVAYRVTGDKVTPLRPQEGRALWRDTGPLALLRQQDFTSARGNISFERPLVVTQLETLISNRLVPKETKCDLAVYGMRTDMKMKIFEWQHETLHLPDAIARRGALGGAAQRAMELAEGVAYALKSAIKHAYPREGKGNAAAFNTRITEAQRDFWARVRGPYEALLHQLATLPEAEDAYAAALVAGTAAWQAALGDTGRRVLGEAIDDLDSDSDALKRVVEARQQFRNALFALFHPEQARGRGRKASPGKEAPHHDDAE